MTTTTQNSKIVSSFPQGVDQQILEGQGARHAQIASHLGMFHTEVNDFVAHIAESYVKNAASVLSKNDQGYNLVTATHTLEAMICIAAMVQIAETNNTVQLPPQVRKMNILLPSSLVALVQELGTITLQSGTIQMASPNLICACLQTHLLYNVSQISAGTITQIASSVLDLLTIPVQNNAQVWHNGVAPVRTETLGQVRLSKYSITWNHLTEIFADSVQMIFMDQEVIQMKEESKQYKLVSTFEETKEILTQQGLNLNYSDANTRTLAYRAALLLGYNGFVTFTNDQKGFLAQFYNQFSVVISHFTDTFCGLNNVTYIPNPRGGLSQIVSSHSSGHIVKCPISITAAIASTASLCQWSTYVVFMGYKVTQMGNNGITHIKY